jgi:photosystem II stability/assembly factor-like uncharacterized protein
MDQAWVADEDVWVLPEERLPAGQAYSRRPGALLAVVMAAILLSTVASLPHEAAPSTAPPGRAASLLTVPGPAVAFIHASGDAAGWAFLYGPGQNSFAHTVDDGTSWSQVDRPSWTLAPGALWPFYFLDSSRAWVVTSVDEAPRGMAIVVRRTADGGRTWQAGEQLAANWSTLFEGIYFLDSRNGWLVFGSQNSPSGVIYRTFDGGARWTALGRRGPGAAPAGSFPYACYIAGLRFSDPVHGWALAGCSDEPGLISSSDGGRTWSRATLPAAIVASSSPSLPQFFSPTDALLVTQSDGFLYTTTNAGRTWTSIALPTTSIATFDFIDMKDGWIVDSDGPVMFRTTDGGVSWQRLPWDPRLDGIVQLQFRNSQIGWAVAEASPTGPSFLMTTSDGGAQWAPAPVIPRPPWLSLGNRES